jgi:hypothetical protein
LKFRTVLITLANSNDISIRRFFAFREEAESFTGFSLASRAKLELITLAVTSS